MEAIVQDITSLLPPAPAATPATKAQSPEARLETSARRLRRLEISKERVADLIRAAQRKMQEAQDAATALKLDIDEAASEHEESFKAVAAAAAARAHAAHAPPPPPPGPQAAPDTGGGAGTAPAGPNDPTQSILALPDAQDGVGTSSPPGGPGQADAPDQPPAKRRQNGAGASFDPGAEDQVASAARQMAE